MMAQVRSISGCWTCRLRRKKCDETLPTCSTCDVHDLCCDGYGQPPHWKDGGMRERRRLAEVKATVKVTLQQKRASKSQQSRVSAQHQQSQLARHKQPIPSTPISLASPMLNLDENNKISTALSTELSNILETSYDWGQRDDNEFGMIEIDMLDGQIGHYQSTGLGGDEETTVACTTTDNLLWDKSTSSLSSQGQADSTSISRSLSPVIPNNQITVDSNVVFNKGANFDSDQLPGLSKSVVGDKTHQSFLLMHYLDQTFYMQFPLHLSSSSNRGWLYSMLMENRPFFYASLSLSAFEREACQHLLQSQRDSQEISSNLHTALFPESNWFLSSALSELQSYLPRFSNVASPSRNDEHIPVAACMMQLVFLEVYRGGPAWEPHLQAASGILTSVIPSVLNDFDQNLNSRVKGSMEGSRPKHSRYLSSDTCLSSPRTDRDSDLMMIEAFLWFDVLASSSNRDRQPLLGQYHEKLLGNDAINCASISGCQNWAVLQMSRVSRLASWKRDSENSGLLSIMDLTKRAMTIEEDIKKGLKALSNDALETSPSSPEQRELSNVTCITKVFALSIVTYLHVVISGAHPELQEIKECVSRTIEDLNQVALKKPQLLKSLIWPICVNGCLATETQESVVKSVVKSLTESRPHIVGSNLTVSRVIEECWKLRKSEAHGSWDWRTTAGKINQRVLLV